MNIWSHLVGFIVFFFLMIWDNTLWIPRSRGTSSDHFIISLTLLCYQVSGGAVLPGQGRCSTQSVEKSIRKKGSSYIAQYPNLRIDQSALHFISLIDLFN